ncbi:MAG: HesA/MoeB/ThiF family protein [bacterium]
MKKRYNDRYHRNILINEIGIKGQKKLKKSNVLIIGCGGLGSSAAYYLTACGIGALGLVDYQKVELSNLQRQILYSERDIGIKKAVAAGRKLISLNSELKLKIHQKRLDFQNINSVLKPYDFIIDATDNFTAKFLINDACVALKKTFVHAGVQEWSGQAITVHPGKSACVRCLFGMPDINKLPIPSEFGILGMVPGVIGTIEAVEAVKYVLKKGKPLINKLLTYNALNAKFRVIAVKKDPNCPVCSKKRY